MSLFLANNYLSHNYKYLNRYSMKHKQKGVTPVIAIVLLIMITVSLVGAINYQIEDLTQDPDTGFLDDHNINIQTAVRQGDTPGEIALRVQNSGNQQLNLLELVRIELSVPGEERLPPQTAAESFEELETLGVQECFTQDLDNEKQVLEPGQIIVCSTGIEMVNPNQETTIHIVESDTGQEIDSYSCNPSESLSPTC